MILLWPLFEETRSASLAGLIVGIASILRFNMPLLGVMTAWIVARSAAWQRRWRSMAVFAAVAGALVGPWVIRNLIVFHGHAVFSTQTGFNTLQGLLMPAGPRSAGKDIDTLRAAAGWAPHDVESNDPQRLALPWEPELNRRAWEVTRRLWKEKGWRLLPLMPRKLAYFWLSTDH